MSLTKEELEKARAEMDRALLPRGENGYFNPVDYTNAPAMSELFAYQEPRPDGSVDPMFLAEEFANNNRPQGFVISWDTWLLGPHGTPTFLRRM